jgi:hypothetical protein
MTAGALVHKPATAGRPLIGSLFTLFGVVFFIVWLSLFLQAFSHISSAG